MSRKKQAPDPPPDLNKGPVKDGQMWVYRYGVRLPVFLSEVELELYCFKIGLRRAQGGLDRYGHFRKAAGILWPKLVWHDWLERQIQSLCDNQWVAWAGCAASGKTFAASLFAIVWWMSDASNTTVVLTSTTAKMIRKRAWAVIRKLHSDAPGIGGNMVDSKTMLQAKKGDDKSAIFGQAVAEGDTAKAVANIQGIHNRRVMVIIDEATDTPEAAFDACANLYSGCSEFICLVIGNPASRFDAMGQFCEPADGWKSVTVDDEEWETREQLNGKRGVVLRFDADKSPNVIAGKTLYPFLVKDSDLQGARRRFGDSSPLYWKFYRGFWAPDGVIKTIFTENLVAKVNGTGMFIFIGNRFFKVAGCDPAFGGGDRPVLQFGECGDVASGLGINLARRILLRIDAGSRTPVHFQLAEQIQKHCQDEGVDPNRFGLDATGEGGGLADIISRQWSNRIVRVEFGGMASEDPVSSEDPRSCRDVYQNMVAQLWFQAREYLIAEQLRGLDASVIKEFCNRLYDDITKPKIQLQTKREMKLAFGFSPDYADAACVMLEVARRSGLILIPKYDRPNAPSSGNWLDFVKKLDQVHNESYADDQE